MASRKAAHEPDVVLGGSLVRDSQGRLYTILTSRAAYPSPKDMQELWSNARRRRYPKTWDGRAPGGPVVIGWTDPARFICGRCVRGLGDYPAYRVEQEYGVVEDTPRRYYPRETMSVKPSADPHDRLSRPSPRFWISGDVAGRAARTTAHFRCAGCGTEYKRNLLQLGRDLFARECREFVLE